MMYFWVSSFFGTSRWFPGCSEASLATKNNPTTRIDLEIQFIPQVNEAVLCCVVLCCVVCVVLCCVWYLVGAMIREITTRSPTRESRPHREPGSDHGMNSSPSILLPNIKSTILTTQLFLRLFCWRSVPARGTYVCVFVWESKLTRKTLPVF